MYSKLLWCGINIILDRVRFECNNSSNIYDLDILESNSKNNKYYYKYLLCDKLFTCEISFATNVSVYGIMVITDIDSKLTYRYTVERLADSIKYTSSEFDHSEVYTCYDKCFISLSINDDLITDISTLEATKQGLNKFNISYTSVATPEECDLNPIMIKTLFAATAALDYDQVVCDNPIFIGNIDTNITIFQQQDKRVICLTRKRDKPNRGNIVSLINSDFNQIFQYNNDAITTIEEYIFGQDNEVVLRRNYTYRYDEDSLIISTTNNTKFVVKLDNNKITFTKQ